MIYQNIKAIADSKKISISKIEEDCEIIICNSFGLGEWELSGFSDGKSVDIYVFSVLYDDNTEWGSKDLSVTDIKNYAPKTHVTGSYS